MFLCTFIYEIVRIISFSALHRRNKNLGNILESILSTIRKIEDLVNDRATTDKLHRTSICMTKITLSWSQSTFLSSNKRKSSPFFFTHLHSSLLLMYYQASLSFTSLPLLLKFTSEWKRDAYSDKLIQRCQANGRKWQALSSYLFSLIRVIQEAKVTNSCQTFQKG